MDMNTARSVVTAISFLAFLGIIYWAYGQSRRVHFESLGRSVLDDTEIDNTEQSQGESQHG